MQDVFGNPMEVGNFVAFSVMSNVTGIRTLSFGIIVPQFKRNTPRTRIEVLPVVNNKEKGFTLRGTMYVAPHNMLAIDPSILPENLSKILYEGYTKHKATIDSNPDRMIRDSRSAHLWDKDYSRDLGIPKDIYRDMQETLKNI